MKLEFAPCNLGLDFSPILLDLVEMPLALRCWTPGESTCEPWGWVWCPEGAAGGRFDVLPNSQYLSFEGNELERPEILHSQLPEDWNDDLDYVLALSLQSENNPHHDSAADIPRDFWEYDYTKEPGQSAHLGGMDLSNIISCDSPESFSTSNHSKIGINTVVVGFILKFEGRGKGKFTLGMLKIT